MLGVFIKLTDNKYSLFNNWLQVLDLRTSDVCSVVTGYFSAYEPILISFLISFRIPSMVTGKRLADIGYRAFSASMMLLTVYGGYLCAMRGYRYMERQKQLKLAAENQDPEVIKDWQKLCFLHTCGHFSFLLVFIQQRIVMFILQRTLVWFQQGHGHLKDEDLFIKLPEN